MEQTYLTTQELSQRIKYDIRTIRERLKDSVLLEGVHYFRPFGGRKILYIWERIEKDMFNPVEDITSIPMGSIRKRNDNGLLFFDFRYKHKRSLIRH